MMKKHYFIFAFLLLNACGVKQTQNLLSAGNYDEAILNSTSNLRSNKDKKGNQDYVYLLEEAFAKAKERDLNSITLWVKEKNPANFEKIFNTYLQLNNRQEKIKPLLPLKLLKERRNAIFPFDNYNDEMVASKNNLSGYLYANAKTLLSSSNKANFRKAFDDLNYLNEINPNYKNVGNLIDDARFKGTDYVLVFTKNETEQIIPARLQNDLLDFNTYGLNNKWTVFHSQKQKGITYDYGMTIRFQNILVSPEQIKEKEFIKEKQIIDGQKRLLDANGKEVIDNTGKIVMVDNLQNATIRIFESRQLKSCQVQAKIDYTDRITNQLTQSFPLVSEFVFENIFATYKGDRRASDTDYYSYFDRRAIPFPSNEQMVYDTGEDLKMKLKELISNNSFRN
jgi:uncharacterized protein YeeX (DUF496 family)